MQELLVRLVDTAARGEPLYLDVSLPVRMDDDAVGEVEGCLLALVVEIPLGDHRLRAVVQVGRITFDPSAGVVRAAGTAHRVLHHGAVSGDTQHPSLELVATLAAAVSGEPLFVVEDMRVIRATPPPSGSFAEGPHDDR